MDPLTHQVSFDGIDVDHLAELLRLSQLTLQDAINRLTEWNPESRNLEVFRSHLERSHTFIDRCHGVTVSEIIDGEVLSSESVEVRRRKRKGGVK